MRVSASLFYIFIYLLYKRITHKPRSMGEEGDDDDVDMPNARSDSICAVEERDAAQSAHGHGYSWIFALELIHIVTAL